ncbi:MAG: hypothetical protein JO247_21755 [Chloroflexi bacterium]|nr:hypothetical protein [Chloroflexota bacterium]
MSERQAVHGLFQLRDDLDRLLLEQPDPGEDADIWAETANLILSEIVRGREYLRLHAEVAAEKD